MRKRFLYALVATTVLSTSVPAFNVTNTVLADSTSVRYEAEDATIQGAEIDNTVEGYSGTGYMAGLKNDSDYLEFHVDVESAGNYFLKINYCAPYGYKQEKVVVNGGASFSVEFQESTEFATIDAGVVKLNAGENTIRINRFWGWTLIDYIEISKADSLGIDTNVSDTLVDTNATKEAKKLMSYLTSIYGKNMLSGQFAYTTKYTELDAIYGATGKYPAMIGLDFSDYSPSRVALGCNPGQDTEKAIEYWNDGGIVSFCWHWASPTKGATDENKWGSFYTEHTDFDLAEALADTESEDYQALIRDIDTIAVEIGKLQDAGVPILWRPLHEASGGWFWWGASGADAYKELWNLMYDRLVEYHGLHNMIWIWNGQSADWYPGDETVDIIGEDIYADKLDYNSQVNGFLKCTKYTDANKMIALSENGVLPDPDNLVGDGVPWLFNMTWGGEFVCGYVGGTTYTEQYTSKEMLQKFYSSEYVLTREELPASLFEQDEEDKMKVELTGVADGDVFDCTEEVTPITISCTTKNADGATITYYANNKEIGTGTSATFTPYGTTTNEDGYVDYVITVQAKKNGRTATSSATIKVKLPVKEAGQGSVTDSDLAVTLSKEANETTGSISFNMNIVNNGADLDLSKFEICYYYTSDDEKMQKVWFDHVALQCNADPWYVALTSVANGEIVPLLTPVDGADNYASITLGDGTFYAGSKLMIQGRMCNTDWSSQLQTNDYSYENGVAIYYNGKLIYGSEPQ